MFNENAMTVSSAFASRDVRLLPVLFPVIMVAIYLIVFN